MEAILAVKFFANSLGTEPVRDWLKGLVAIDRKTIGEDIKTVQLGLAPWDAIGGAPRRRSVGGQD